MGAANVLLRKRQEKRVGEREGREKRRRTAEGEPK